ncbi:hypothetical protein [Atlantibacter hermannii]|nr:hypothetical protein [Atlantibacter hermannii]QPS90192.1 hypothetical protein I6G45_11500 [Atlantibacter hermannii]VDZ72974.1 Uncharacterised protein [Atlantibacter hermannii]
MESERIRFESLFRSIFRNKFKISRTHLGYDDPFVDSCFFFWQSRGELA